MFTLPQLLEAAAAAFILGALALAAWYDWQTGRVYAARAQRVMERAEDEEKRV